MNSSRVHERKSIPCLFFSAQTRREKAMQPFAVMEDMGIQKYLSHSTVPGIHQPWVLSTFCNITGILIELSQYFVEPLFAAITAASLVVDVSNSIAHLQTDIFAHSSLQYCSRSVRLNEDHLRTGIFKSYQRFRIGFRSGTF